ncbi:hypothetical protein BT63DRAFT_441300 [Microthyrium microscopicum]|uniref:Trafficking protein particle complex subunit 11 domain-containing protein n=1 Tax=Microthyrium microscopicum TaxID=703497 RepID=A0A6A6U7V1_9PEZI|nr:hypothetical protein BT63DRAFT_441300 [Microthyrium microscopicum]
MEAYPPEYTAHNYPFVVLSGLTPTPEDQAVSPDGKGPLIRAQLPLVTNERKDELLQDFLKAEGSDNDWSGRSLKVQHSIVGFRFKSVGREYRLPPKKADPPSPQILSRANSFKDDEDAKVPTRWVLHSPLSPLTPTSPLYPDGVIDSLWMTKYQERVPCLYIAFFDFSSDANLNSLNDNQLKSDITDMKAALNKSESRTKLVVVLLSDKTILEAPDIEERLATIRRATGLDPKSGLFFLPPDISRVEVTAFVQTLLSTVQPLCIEYYRDLTKHSRRKKNRGSAPAPTVAPTTASGALGAYGWSIRYDVKMGVFAEFRQEMDAACRHYTSALESLMGPEGTFETTASWSPRWDEARIIADMMAFRIIRCLLWSQMGTTATQSWVNYRDRMRELVDRRGKGSTNYGWEAWESRWAKLMAQLIQRAEIQALSMADSIDLTVSSAAAREFGNPVYMNPEKSIPINEKVLPWHHLHHPGYWMRLSARSAKRRKRYALDMPEEDRTPPGQSPASAVAHRSNTYDIYLCPEPHEEYPIGADNEGFDHTKDIVARLQSASDAFKERSQTRFSERTQLEIGRELLRKGAFQEATNLLKTLWERSAWRKERWWMPLFELTRTLNECAQRAGDIAVLASTVFELHSPHLRLFRDMKLDLMNCGQSLKAKPDGEKPSVQLTAGAVVSFIMPGFAFSSGDGYVGQTTLAQLRVVSDAHPNTAPISFSKIRAQFKPDRYQLELTHSPTEEPSSSSTEAKNKTTTFLDVSENKAGTASDDGNVLYSSISDLTFGPGSCKVWLLGMDVKDPGELELQYLEFEIDNECYKLTVQVEPGHFARPYLWHISDDNGPRDKRIGKEAPWIAEIKPKPPKLDVSILNLDRAIHTDETVNLDFKITNFEGEDVTATLDVRLLSKLDPPEISWLHEEESTESDTPNTATTDTRTMTLPKLTPEESITKTASFKSTSTPSELVLETKLHYTLPSEPDVPLSKIFTASLNLTSAFEANYDFSPRIHPDPWPSYFSIDTPTPGLLQRWSLTTHMASFASETLHVHSLAVEMDKVPKGLTHHLAALPTTDSFPIAPGTMHTAEFLLDTTRPPTKEHRPMTLSARLFITWSRTPTSATVTSSLPISALVLPPLEPRVIATAAHSNLTPSTPLTQLTLTLENPSQHPLTFDISAPSSEALAFSGPKTQGVTLLPYSRVEVSFRLLPLVKGAHVVFGVMVKDRYFVREVPVLTGEGLSAVEGGGLRCPILMYLWLVLRNARPVSRSEVMTVVDMGHGETYLDG